MDMSNFTNKQSIRKKMKHNEVMRLTKFVCNKATEVVCLEKLGGNEVTIIH
jgi:hypothetical protein